MKTRPVKIKYLVGILTIVTIFFFRSGTEQQPVETQPESRATVTIKKRIYKRDRPRPITVYNAQPTEQEEENFDTATEEPAEVTAAVPVQPQQDTAAEEPEEILPMPVLVFVSNSDGSIPMNTIVVGSCRIFERVDDEGYAEVMITEDCSIALIRKDGFLNTRTIAETITYSPDDMVELDFTFPVERKGGLGVQISETEEGIEVQRIIPGSPAEELGLQPGDVIVQVDDTHVSEIDIDEFIDKMTGPEGTTVTFRLQGQSEDEPPLTLTRTYMEDPQM